MHVPSLRVRRRQLHTLLRWLAFPGVYSTRSTLRRAFLFLLMAMAFVIFTHRAELKLMHLNISGYPVAHSTCPDGPPRYKLIGFTVFKNTAGYLAEWLEFHKVLGIEHFVLFNNESNDEFMQVLHPFIDSGYVTLKNWATIKARDLFYRAVVNTQKLGIIRAIEDYQCLTEWMVVFDVDEFLFPVKGNPLNLPKLLEKEDYKGRNCAGVVLPRYQYGSSGHLRVPEGSVIKNYLGRAKGFPDLDGKVIFQPRLVSKVKNTHWFWFTEGSHMCDEYGETVYSSQRSWTADKLRINHYYTKSKEDWARRLGKGVVCGPGGELGWRQFEAAQDDNIIDDAILQVIAEMSTHEMTDIPVDATFAASAAIK